MLLEDAIEIMKKHIVDILDCNKLSIYIYGSVVLQDFKLGWSDIDILCLTEKPITDVQAIKLLRLKQDLSKTYNEMLYFNAFEGAFLSIDGFINSTFDRVVYFGTSGEKIKEKYTLDCFSKIELLDSGKLIYGMDIRSRLKYPDEKEIVGAVKYHYDTIRKYAVKTDRSLYSAGWFLDISRCIYTLKTGKIISKTQAGRWAIENNLVLDLPIMENVLKIREEPLKYKDDIETLRWLENLGEAVQSFADVLERELKLKE